ncbi:hypothetical protein D7V86_01580 [bacterium D16-51]|nr:hypothetical protein D7V96_01010 [bacterium D16-59]RKI62491.1 hypothetical protein D7V86_01580 [bacterium D16-51]
MKNSNFFPFERNKYFYGKLLSVDDFELEQKYMNDKRRMLNRFILGSGVVAGLYVVRTDEQTVSVEAGFALDSWGREIVVDVPVIKKLSLIEGFGECNIGDAKDVYLCLEYDENETDRVHNIAGNETGQGQGGGSFRKIREGYRLFLTNREPEGDTVSPSGWYQVSQTIYQEGDIRITQVMPRYIRAGGTAQIKIQVENRGRSNVSFSYDLVLNCLLSDGKAKIRVSFDEVLFERTGRYEIAYPIQASDTVLEEGDAVIDPETVSLRLSGIVQEVHMEAKMTTNIVAQDEKEAMQKEYYRSSMGKIIRTGYKQPVYLARLQVVSAADTYIIERIENVPFGQYVSNHVIEAALYQMMQKELMVLEDRGGRQDGIEADRVREKGEGMKIAQGVTDIYLTGGQRGDKFFSSEIVHGLGLGKVTVILGMERESGKVVYGSSEIFEEDKEKGVDAELAACVDEDNGSFVVGVRLLSAVLGGKIHVHWTAFKDKEDIASERNEKRIFIKPNLLELTVRQSHYLEAVCENMVEKAVSWSVKDKGGFIDENGLYTAPNTSGVYEAVAQSVAFPEIRASIFVVVRDNV